MSPHAIRTAALNEERGGPVLWFSTKNCGMSCLPLWGNVVNLRNAGRGLATIRVPALSPLAPLLAALRLSIRKGRLAAFGVTLPCSLASFATVRATGAWLIRPRSRGDGGTEFAWLRPARLLKSAMTGAAFFVSTCAFCRPGAGRSPAQCGRSPQQPFPRPRESGDGD